MNGKYISSALFVIVSALGSVYLLVEAVMQAMGTSICASEGCRLVARLTRFGDISTVVIGLVTLGALTALSGLNLRRESAVRDALIDLVLIAALAAEGFFVGYQLFWLPALCVFCMSVFGIFLALALLRLPARRREMLAALASFGVVLGFVFLVLAPGGTALPLDRKMVLFYSVDCRHCAEIKEEIAKNKLDVTPVLVEEYSATLRNLGVEHVPTLFVNGPYEKLVFTGKDAIRRYLATCQPSGQGEKTSSPTAPAVRKKAPGPGTGPSQPLTLFPPLGTPDQIFNPPPDEGLCKEEQKCE